MKWGILGSLARSDGEDGVDLAGAGAAERLGQHLHRPVVVGAAKQAQQHRGVVHATFAVAVAGVVGQHRAELPEAALLPQFHHAQVHLLVEFAGPVVDVGLGVAVVREAVRERAGGQHQHLAVALLDGPAHGGAEREAVFFTFTGA